MSTILAILLLALVILANAWLTRRLWQSPLYEHQQKLAQTALLWCLPVVGAVVIHAALRHGDDVPELMPNRESGEHEALWDGGDDSE